MTLEFTTDSRSTWRDAKCLWTAGLISVSSLIRTGFSLFFERWSIKQVVKLRVRTPFALTQVSGGLTFAGLLQSI